MKRYQAISSLLMAIENCIAEGNDEWLEKHNDRLDEILMTAPSGAGFDCGTQLDVSRPLDPEKLIFHAWFHHMDENGYYDGWTHNTIVITPSLVFGINIDVRGADRNGILDYVSEVFEQWLTEEETIHQIEAA